MICIEDDTTDVEGGLANKSEDDEIPVMDTGLDHHVPKPEVNNNYVKSSVIFTGGNTYTRGNVIGRNRDSNGNSIGRMNYNPILDTQKYCVEFDDVEVRKLTANVITDYMYAAGDDYGNDYLMM